MSASSSRGRVRQRTEEDSVALRAKSANRQVIPKRNVVRGAVLVAPLDVMNEIIQTYNWGNLYNCACIVLTRLVRKFYTHLKFVQDVDSGIVLQSTIEGHVILVDPQVISQIIGVPVLQISAQDEDTGNPQQLDTDEVKCPTEA
jgi:hypothetical protein